MSPVTPAVIAPFQAALNDSLATLAATSAASFGVPFSNFEIIDFNGSWDSFPPTVGREKVGVQHLTIRRELENLRPHPNLCSSNKTLPLLREKYGENGVSYFNAICSGIRYIQASVFYPACKAKGPQPKFANVFTDSLLDVITKQVFENSSALHNIQSQALTDAPVCPGEYHLTLLTPAVGGQRQIYTQLASEIVALENQVVVTVDHSHQSGAIEFGNHSVLYNLAGELVQPREANYARIVDLLAVAHHFYNESNLDQESWESVTIRPNDTYVFGHGQGGMVAQMMVGSNIFPGGGSLNGFIKMPAPYQEINVLYRNHTSPSKPKPTPKPKKPTVPGQPSPPGKDDTILGRLKAMARGLQKTMMDSLSGLMCRVIGTCGTLVEKRQLAADDFGELLDVQHHKHPSSDSAKRISDLCFYHCEVECEPKVPHGFFPSTPSQQGKTLPDGGDPESQFDWDLYHDPGSGDYQGRPQRSPYRDHGESNCYDAGHCFKKCYPRYPGHKHTPHSHKDYDGKDGYPLDKTDIEAPRDADDSDDDEVADDGDDPNTDTDDDDDDEDDGDHDGSDEDEL